MTESKAHSPTLHLDATGRENELWADCKGSGGHYWQQSQVSASPRQNSSLVSAPMFYYWPSPEGT